MRLYDTKRDSDSIEDEESTYPFRMTKAELQSLDPNFKQKKKKKKPKEKSSKRAWSKSEQGRLHYASTIGSQLKQRVPANVDLIWDDLDDTSSLNLDSSRDGRGDRDEDDESPTAVQKKKTLDSGGDPTYEMACVRRYITGTESIGQFIENSRKMFLLQYSLSVKGGERTRLEKELRKEERELQKTESELRLSEQAFDQFLQENDRKAVEAMKRADHETRIRTQKTTKLKQVDNRIITLKREISKLKDILAEYGTYQGFLSDLSPQSWRDKQKTSDDKDVQPAAGDIFRKVKLKSIWSGKKAKGLKNLKPRKPEPKKEEGGATDKKDGASLSVGGDKKDGSTAVGTPEKSSDEGIPSVPFEPEMLPHLDMSEQEIDKAKGEVKLFFQDPRQLLSIFTELENENLNLIQECREAEGNLEKIRNTVHETRSRLNQQADNFTSEIQKLESRIDAEIKAGRELRKIQMEQRAKEEEEGATAEAKRAEDKVLKELDRSVRGIYSYCVGEQPDPMAMQQQNLSSKQKKALAALTFESSTMDLLKKIELRMEMLTQELERLPEEKVKIAQRTCERERRQRELEARLERQRQIEADRNKKALDRALAPPFIKPELRKQETKRVVTTTKRKRKKAKVVGGVVQRRDSSTTSVPVPFGSY